MTKAIVTGGAGFIGSHIVDELLRRGIETYVIDDLSTGSQDNLSTHMGDEKFHFILGDAKRTAELVPADVSDIDVVFHEAAIASVPRSVKEPMTVHDANVNASLEVMNFCVTRRVRRIIFASSAAVYGVLGDEKALESMVCRPSSPYGASKMAVEDYLHAYRNTYGLETVALRYFNVFGPRQAHSEYSGVMTLFIDRMLRGQPLTVYGDGQQVRDFVNVRDIVQANMLAMESPAANGEVFNVATGKKTSILDVIELLEELAGGNPVQWGFAPPRPGDVKFGLASIEKIQSVLRYRPTVSMKKGLAELLEHARSKIETPFARA